MLLPQVCESIGVASWGYWSSWLHNRPIGKRSAHQDQPRDAQKRKAIDAKVVAFLNCQDAKGRNGGKVVNEQTAIASSVATPIASAPICTQVTSRVAVQSPLLPTQAALDERKKVLDAFEVTLTMREAELNKREAALELREALARS